MEVVSLVPPSEQIALPEASAEPAAADAIAACGTALVMPESGELADAQPVAEAEAAAEAAPVAEAAPAGKRRLPWRLSP